MYLRDLDLDIPYRINMEFIEKIMSDQGCTYEQAIQKDYEDNWKWNIRRRFTLETRCMSSMFLRLIGKVKTEDCSKILINCVGDKAKEGISNCMGVYTLEHSFDYNSFFLRTDYEKKVLTLNIIKESVNKIACDRGWDFTFFQSIFNEIRELEYDNSWTWGKRLKSPNKTYTAEVHLEHKVKDIDIYICIRNKKDEVIAKEVILSELPHEFSYSRHLGKLTWTSGNEVQLKNKKGDKVGSIIL